MTIDKLSIITSAYKKNVFKIIYKLRFLIFNFPFFTIRNSHKTPRSVLRPPFFAYRLAHPHIDISTLRMSVRPPSPNLRYSPF